jgi:hypothetical protein
VFDADETRFLAGQGCVACLLLRLPPRKPYPPDQVCCRKAEPVIEKMIGVKCIAVRKSWGCREPATYVSAGFWMKVKS